MCEATCVAHGPANCSDLAALAAVQYQSTVCFSDIAAECRGCDAKRCAEKVPAKSRAWCFGFTGETLQLLCPAVSSAAATARSNAAAKQPLGGHAARGRCTSQSRGRAFRHSRHRSTWSWDYFASLNPCPEAAGEAHTFPSDAMPAPTARACWSSELTGREKSAQD